MLKNIIQKLNKKSFKTIKTRLKALKDFNALIGKNDSEYFSNIFNIFKIVLERIFLAEKEREILIEANLLLKLSIEKF